MVAIAMVATVATVGLMVVSAKERKGEALMQLRKSLRLSNCIPFKKYLFGGAIIHRLILSVLSHTCAKGRDCCSDVG